jgi:hypothetical protein
MISKEFIEENKKKLLAEQKRIKSVLDHEDIKDGKGEFPGDYKPKFDELGNEEGENASKAALTASAVKATKSKKKDCVHYRRQRLV